MVSSWLNTPIIFFHIAHNRYFISFFCLFYQKVFFYPHVKELIINLISFILQIILAKDNTSAEIPTSGSVYLIVTDIYDHDFSFYCQ